MYHYLLNFQDLDYDMYIKLCNNVHHYSIVHHKLRNEYRDDHIVPNNLFDEYKHIQNDHNHVHNDRYVHHYM